MRPHLFPSRTQSVKLVSSDNTAGATRWENSPLPGNLTPRPHTRSRFPPPPRGRSQQDPHDLAPASAAARPGRPGRRRHPRLRGAPLPLNSAPPAPPSTAPGRTTRQHRSPMNRPETIEETAVLVDAAGGAGIAVQVDHTEPAQVESLIARIRNEQAGRLDILVNDIWGGEDLIAWGPALLGAIAGRRAVPAPSGDPLPHHHQPLLPAAHARTRNWPGRRGNGRQYAALPRPALLRPGQDHGDAPGAGL